MATIMTKLLGSPTSMKHSVMAAVTRAGILSSSLLEFQYSIVTELELNPLPSAQENNCAIALLNYL